jgi:hypothetical protein
MIKNLLSKIKSFFSGEDNYIQTFEEIDDDIKNDAKKKIGFMLLLLPIVGFILVVLFKTGVKYYDYHYGSKPNMEQEKVVKDVNTEIKLDDGRIWRTRTDKEIRKTKESVENAEKAISEVHQKIDTQTQQIQTEMQQRDVKIDQQHNELVDLINEQNKALNNTMLNIETNFDKKIGDTKKDILAEGLKNNKPTKLDLNKLIPFGVQTNNSSTNATSTPTKPIQTEKVEFIDINDNISEFEVSTFNNYKQEEQKPEKPKSFIMDAGFAKATILAAGEFNTMTKGDDDRVPIFFSLDTKVITPNGGEADLTNCMLRGAGKGDFTTSKVPVKIVKLDCRMTDDDGVHYRISKTINGAVYDETGGYALKGRMITKEGEIFAKAIPIALLETGLNILTEKASNNDTKNTQDVFNFTGASTQGAADIGQTIVNKMGEYWLDYLDALNPKIDVRPGRQVVIAFFGGEVLEIKKYIPADLENFEKGLIDASYIDATEQEEKMKAEGVKKND